MTNTTDHLIISSPYEKPKTHLKYVREIRKFEIVDGRRPAGYVVASESSKSFDDPGHFIELPLVNQIRKRVDKWRESGYPGVTSITKSLLEYWKNPEREMKLFFCQLEAIETLIWLVEAPASEKQGIKIPDDGGEFQRICSKMATGTGKTVVMAMLIAWQILNKITYPKDNRFSKNILVVAPGLTVKSRLQVLKSSNEQNYYSEFDMIPSSEFDKLRQGKIKIINWHMLAPLDAKSLPPVMRKKVGEESDEAFTKRVLGDFSDAKNILIINDEAHHAWRTNIKAEGKYQRVSEDKDSAEEATIWIGGLDRINKTRGILSCHDFSATPFAPSGKRTYEETLFGWIVSDFGLNDSIESGLVKTPRVVIRDDGTLTKDMKSRFYHIYMDSEVKASLNKKAEETDPLPDLVVNAYYFLGKDWLETKKLWGKEKVKVPPVLITVCNRTETAARVENSFKKGKIRIDELKDTERMLRIDSDVLKKAEEKDTEEAIKEENGLSKQEQAEILRKKVDTVGKVGEMGEQIQNIIAVAMLSEGWDAKTVTHIMGLRAFSSQLLCEQVVGRGLRRTSYEVNPETGLFDAEYVNIFGVPFTFLPHEGTGETIPAPPKPKTRIFVEGNKKEYEIKWPNVLRINHIYRPKLSLDTKKVKSFELNPEDTPMLVEMAPVIEGKPNVEKIREIELESLGKKYRMQRLIFETTRDIYEQMQPSWQGDKDSLLMQLVKIVEDFLNSDKLIIKSKTYNEELKRRVLILLNMSKIVQHLFSAIRFENTEEAVAVYDKEQPIKSTGKMMTWYTSKRCELVKKSHISHVVIDSGWEASEAFEFDRNKDVKSWVKNDHIGFVINYIYKGIIHKYYPDFLIKLNNNQMLILEVKGKDDQQNNTKREYLQEWINAVNRDGRFGKWTWDVSFRPSDVKDIIKKHA
ncbi:DEAD/DEAH box helicase family protein [Candidatus Pacearchaeota archaeon]|nr:DEAD/DEAH box helicase family protein [Candidatus Pacearchaeota archaeon]